MGCCHNPHQTHKLHKPQQSHHNHMSEIERTTIQLKKPTAMKIHSLKNYGESADSVVNRLLEAFEEKGKGKKK